MDAIDRAAIRRPSIPSELVHRYRHDAVFHRLVRVLLDLLRSSDGVEVGAADIREASIVADEIRREIAIEERMNEPFEMVIPKDGPDDPCPAPASRMPRKVKGR